MRIHVILSGVLGAVLMFGPLVCHAAKWDKNDYANDTIESGYYDATSIKAKGKLVSWTERYVLTSAGIVSTNAQLNTYKVCKENIEKKGNVTQYQLDYQIETGKFRGVAKRYYNKANELLCTNKDTGNDLKSDWNMILRGSSIEQAQYDLVTKYKIKFQ